MRKVCRFWFSGKPFPRGISILMSCLFIGLVLKLSGYERVALLVDRVSISLVGVITVGCILFLRRDTNGPP